MSPMKVILSSIRISLFLMLLCGLLYNVIITGIAQAVMPGKASGSIIYNEKGDIVGSELIGQSFTDPQFFQSRVSSIEYKAEGSGTPNYAPSNPDMIKRVQESIEAWKAKNPDVPVSELPIDLISNSGSGLDPHISPEAALAQIPRISKLTGIAPGQLESLVSSNTQAREFGILGEPAVNVLKLNLDLQKKIGK
ncbi:potassium-transporting ATPase subunit KdpC [Paenibacillus oryzisoli]|uniref:Potassium-transporting ATPase KdpC subunit n=1 Tax=Paenibacillus oryzisoli TaxID=1850517 RepID=A0A198AH49_9BACL|nr:potassium-transporting ATPase subunit KdpC [Paenibacillus oryzisoli]OAS20415.1 K+-transporting ATPase subunit C [Paenibacillus oryzisoli]